MTEMIGWIGLIVGVIGVILAIFFGLTSKRRRELVFSVNPVRTRVVTSGQATDLQVLFHNEPLGNIDITAVQFAIWNAGNESIKKEHIRKNIVISTNPPVRILEALIRNQSPETELSLLNSTDLTLTGKVPLSWKILERNDGASIQLIYLGNPDIDIFVEGLIEGQGYAKEVVISSNYKSPQAHRKSLRNNIIWEGISLLVLGVFAILKFGLNVKVDLIDMLYIFSIFSAALALLGIISSMREKFPPFGF